ncbi:twin-arginine translocation signal domain-containing protein, partial [Chitiniphilus shinanonensis]|uniref:twin-arginine translocation signal domain-containing protein n=1 Tax=Chitiniphilus shinanonensis TaxID=553088 RepID=UPI0024E11A01
MNRRDFLKLSLLAGGLAAFPGLIPTAFGAVSVPRRTLVSVTLGGGPDFRHLFAPALAANEPADSYAMRWWAARATSQGLLADQRHRDAYLQRFGSAYQALTLPGTAQAAGLGVLASCGWLKEQWDAG